MTEFRLPDLGEGLTEAEIVSWHVAAGDRVVADQPLLSVETEKAVVDLPSPRAGRIARLVGAPGDRVAVGAVLVEYEQDGTARADAGAVVGTLPAAPPAEESRADAADRPPAAPPASPSPLPPLPPLPASPVVRALARRLGVDLATVASTGPGGRPTTADVERAAGGGEAPNNGAPNDVTRATPLRGPRRTMAVNMARAHAQVATTTVMDDADIEAWTPHTAVTPRLLRALAVATTARPALNAWFDGEALTLQPHDRVDIGVAVETEHGLFVPVLRDVARRSTEELRRELDALEEAARTRTLRPEQLRDPTIALSNFGTLAGRYAQLIVVPPQVAILGAGRASERVVARDGAAVIRRMLPLSLTFDHRPISGGDAAAFLAALIADLERPA